MIWAMKMQIFTHRAGLICTLAGMSLLSNITQAYAQVENFPGDEPKFKPENGPFVVWLVVIVFALGILGISFKSSKRTHRLED